MNINILLLAHIFSGDKYPDSHSNEFDRIEKRLKAIEKKLDYIENSKRNIEDYDNIFKLKERLFISFKDARKIYYTNIGNKE